MVGALMFLTPPEALGRPGLEPGAPAPPIEVEHVFEGPDPGSFGRDLDGRPLVLEFWATWCAPCVAAIPHWNELVSELEGEPIRFVSLSDEDPELVGRFLERRPIAGWTAIDSDRSAFDAYGVGAIPVTVLIDGEGVVQGVAHPGHLEAAAVRDLIAGRPLDLPPPRPDVDATLALELDPEGKPEPLFQAMLRPSTAEDGHRMMSGGPGFYRALGMGLTDLMHPAYGVRRSRLVVEDGLLAQRYDVEVRVHPEKDFKPFLAAALESGLDLATGWEQREVEVFVLGPPASGTSKLRPSTAEGPAYERTAGYFGAKNVTMGRLARELEHLVGRPVVDETGLDGTFEVELTWELDDPASLPTAVRDQLGLGFEPARRELEMFVVRSRAEPEG